MHPHEVQLTTKAAEAFAQLLPLLACGEQAAAIAFRRLSNSPALDRHALAELALIEAEEQLHDALLVTLQVALPRAANDREIRIQARHFHLSLLSRCPYEHLAQIAAVDAATCTILARLTARDRPLTLDERVCSNLRRIQRDEARHVGISRHIASHHPDRRQMQTVAAAAREGLAKLLLPAARAFERLGVDPDLLLRNVARLPDGLM